MIDRHVTWNRVARARRGLHTIAALTAVACLAACQSEPLGSFARYSEYAIEEIPLRTPANAPRMSQQFAPMQFDVFPGHHGIDIVAPQGTPVIAAAPGVVLKSWYDPRYGNRVLIAHGPDGNGVRTYTRYFHLKTRTVTPHTQVARGEQIGTMGATGFLGLKVHLHFEVLRGQRALSAKPGDPNKWWLNGPGRVTCFRPDLAVPTGQTLMSYPVPCAPEAARL